MNNMKRTYVKINLLPRVDRLKKVHHLIEQVLKVLTEKAVRGIQCTEKEQKPVTIYLVLGS